MAERTTARVSGENEVNWREREGETSLLSGRAFLSADAADQGLDTENVDNYATRTHFLEGKRSSCSVHKEENVK